MPQISGLLIADEHEKHNTFLQELHLRLLKSDIIS
jgi:hypothetical protein